VQDAALDRAQHERAEALGAGARAEDQVEQQAQLGRIVELSARPDPLEQHPLGVLGEAALGALAPIEEVAQRLDVQLGPGGVLAPALPVEMEQELRLVAPDRAVAIDRAAQLEDVIGPDPAGPPDLGLERGESLWPPTLHGAILLFLCAPA
jgi:hypothetical protein